jgi:hypothetical protein
MTNPADSSVQNLLPVQAYFNTDGSFNTFIGQGVPFYATANPSQSGLNITSSTINSTTIGATTPSTGIFTNIGTTTGTVSTAPSGATDIANKQYVDYYAAGLSWKAPVLTATSANITLSGLQTINGVTVVAGDRVLVKNQSTASQNGIYTASATAWTYAIGADDWAEYVGAIVFIVDGSLTGTAWYCTAQPGGTLGVTAMNWSNFSVASSYTAGTGLTLTGTQFSITNTGVSAATYGSASSVPVIAFNAQGQATSVTNTSIAINGNQITSGTIGSSYLSGTYSGITGLGTLLDLTVTNAIVGSITGNAATATTAGSATTATTATNIAGGASGSIPYQTASGATSLLAKGTDGQILTLASGLPSWINNAVGTVTSVSGTGTVSGISLSGTVTSTGSLTLGGTLDLSAPPAIGGTTPNTGAFTTVTASSSLTTPTVQATNSGGLALKNSAGTTQISMGGGGGDNVSINVSTNLNGSNAQIDISPTGTGHVHINPTGSGSIEMNPTSAGVMNNMVIGGTTPLAATFTTLRVNSTISLAGSTGTSGYVLTSAGASAPTWSALPASSITITDDTTTNATRYLAFTSATSGSITGQNVASTKLQFNPSTGILTATGFAGALNGTVGATTANTGAFTTLSASSTVSGTGFTNYLASPPSIGTTAPGIVRATYGYSANITLSDAATVAWDTTTGQVATFTFVSTNRTMGAPTGIVNGGFYALAVIQNGGSNTLTWNSVFKWASGTAPTLSTAASAKDYFTFRSDGTNLYQQGSSLGVA